MMSTLARRVPTLVMHFTHIDNLANVLEFGLRSDNDARATGVISTEVANLEIKERRRRRSVPLSPGGVVADYVPFYFRAPSPMMSAIAHRHGVDFAGGTSRLIYAVTSLERLLQGGQTPIITDRNASLEVAGFRYFEDSDPLDDGFIDWDVMRAQYWNNFPDGKERRMAECLIHRRVDSADFIGLVARSEVVAGEARGVVASVGSSLEVRVRPDWYL